MKVQYEPVMLGVLALFLGNAFLGIPFFSGFPIDILSGVVNVFLLFYALIRRRLFRLQMLASPSLCYGCLLYTSLHNLFAYTYVLHVHPTLVNGLTCGKGAQTLCEQLLGKDVLWIDIDVYKRQVQRHIDFLLKK